MEQSIFLNKAMSKINAKDNNNTVSPDIKEEKKTEETETNSVTKMPVANKSRLKFKQNQLDYISSKGVGGQPNGEQQLV